jgi:threonine/homoserine/homoserine lactone efflux protein
VEQLPSFLAVAAGAMLIPGPDTLVVLRVSLANGAISGTWAAAGSGVGNLIWGSATVVGATGLLAASPGAFTALKLAGAAYLALLGVQALVAAIRGVRFHSPDERPPALRRSAAFRRGLASDVLNVKVGLFWTALVPQFLTPGTGPLLPIAMVAAMGCLAFGWLSAYAWMSCQMASTLSGRRVSQALNTAIGLAFLALGANLAESTAGG